MPLLAASVPVYAGNDFYIPAFEVSLGGRRQIGDVLRDVTAATYRDNVNAVDSFELTVNNWDAEKRKFKYSDRDLFEPKTKVELRMGYRGAGSPELRTMIRGAITSLQPTFPASGQPVLTVGGANVLETLRGKPTSDKYEGLTLTQIARRVCGRLGVTFRGPKAGAMEAVQADAIQNNVSDLEFLDGLARRAGYALAVEEELGGTVLAFQLPSASDKPVYKLRYGRTLTEFMPSLDFNHQVSDVAVRGFDTAKGVPIEVTVGQSQIGADGLKSKMKSGSTNPVAGRREVINDVPVADEQAARDLAATQLRRINGAAVVASGSTVGLPDLRAGSLIEVDGLGLRFNGRYFVTDTTHAIGMSGYTTKFNCRLVELSHRSAGEALA